MDASIKGQIDYLLGLKENVIIGRLIPVTETLLTKYYGSEKDKEAIIEEQIEQVWFLSKKICQLSIN